jgi:anion-transporting  ArsA/GET3 family ATPase
MDFERWCSTSRVVIVAGKGGVGKTTVSAALAVAAKQAGLNVLIVEVEGKSGLAATFDRPPLTYEEVELRPGIRARTLTPDDALVEYLQDHGLRRIGRRLSQSGALEVVSTAVPGMKDILVLGKVKQLEREGVADLIVLDAPAAGHAVQFLLSARGLLDAVSVGPVNRQAAEVIELLGDPTRCQVMLVTLPEETPVNELVDTAYAIEDRAGVALGPIVVNGCAQEIDGLCSQPFGWGAAQARSDATELGIALSDTDADALASAASVRVGLRARQQEQRVRLSAHLPLPQIELPFLFTADLGPDEIDTLAVALIAGVLAMDPAPTR